MADALAERVLGSGARWHLDAGKVQGRLYAVGRVCVAAEGPGEWGGEALEALARSYVVGEPYLDQRCFRRLMACQRVPPSATDAWLRGAWVTESGVYLYAQPPW